MKKRYITFSLLLTILYILFRMVGFGWVENLELVTLNFRMKLRGSITHSDKVKIVGIDDQSLSELYYQDKNPWPWRRDVYSRIINKLGEAGIKSVIMDISFDTYKSNDLTGDRSFATTLFTHPFVTIGSHLVNSKSEFDRLNSAYKEKIISNRDYLRFRYKLSGLDSYFMPEFFSSYLLIPPENLFRNTAWAYGTYEIGLPGEDGLYHSVPLVIKEEYLSEQNQGSLVLLPNVDILGLAAYFDIEPGDYILDLKENKIHLGDKRSIPVDTNGYFTINYYGKRAFDEISVVDILKMEQQELKSIFEDKMALIGYTANAKGIFDLRPTPFNKNEAGVQIHATLVQNIIDESYLQRAPFWLNLIVICSLVYLSFNILALSNLHFSIILDIVMIIIFAVVNYILFLNNIWLDLFYPLLILTLLLLYKTIIKVYQENKERIQTKNFFSRYVPPSVVEEILKNPDQIKPGGQRMEITVLFSDIVGFTKISEELEPEELLRLLNEYFSEMTKIIKDEYQGTLDKFIGDAILAIFGAPFSKEDDALRAVRAGLAMNEKADELTKRWEERGEEVVFSLGIGINTGPAIVGNIGSDDRINYTCIGDSVNVGARLEGATRETKTSILISSSTYEQVKEEFNCKKIPSLRVKGKKEALTVYSVISKNKNKRS